MLSLFLIHLLTFSAVLTTPPFYLCFIFHFTSAPSCSSASFPCHFTPSNFYTAFLLSLSVSLVRYLSLSFSFYYLLSYYITNSLSPHVPHSFSSLVYHYLCCSLRPFILILSHLVPSNFAAILSWIKLVHISSLFQPETLKLI